MNMKSEELVNTRRKRKDSCANCRRNLNATGKLFSDKTNRARSLNSTGVVRITGEGEEEVKQDAKFVNSPDVKGDSNRFLRDSRITAF